MKERNDTTHANGNTFFSAVGLAADSLVGRPGVEGIWELPAALVEK